ncbi:MAG: glycosyltransferase, partial [Phycisphaerales bacterium]|nr:glycosyltransferase [Phycisphaerales bacterium]
MSDAGDVLGEGADRLSRRGDGQHVQVPSAPTSRLALMVPERVVDPVDWVAHAPFVMWLVEQWEPQQVVGLGVETGNSFLAICQAAKAAGVQCSVVGIDPWIRRPGSAGGGGEDTYQSLRLHCESAYPSSAMLMRCQFDDAVGTFADGSIDLLHVDGSRDYDAVRHDYHTWLPKMSDQGVMLFHETRVREPATCGVWRLWAEIRRYYPHCEFAHANGLGVLFVGSALSARRAALRDALADKSRFEQLGGIFAALGDAVAAGRGAALRRDELAEEVRALAGEVGLRGAAISRLHGTLERVREERDRDAARARAVGHLEAELAHANAQLVSLEERLTRALAEIDSRHDALAAANASLDAASAALDSARAGHDEAITRGQARADAMACHIRELERACGSRAHEVAELSGELSKMRDSSSWRLTAPLRAMRRAAVTKPRESLVRVAAGLVRAMWRACPMTDGQRHRVRDWLFSRAGPVLRRTHAWQAWSIVQGAAAPHDWRDRVSAGSRQKSVQVASVPQPVRAIAMYLPQFHRIRENDQWWGAGFTEWTNVRRAKPFYLGHAHPAVPHPDVGYYDLDDPEVLERQAALARQFGIHGFCFYYYWFGGRRVLERPLDRMLSSGRPDFPFCICWANEDWTRAWDGRGSEVLIGQDHSAEGDERFILDVLPLLRDPRYIRVDGKPLLVVYRPGLLSNPRVTAARWRDVCRREGIGEIHLASVRSFDKADPRDIGFDATIQFPPLQIPAKDRSADAPLMTDPGFGGVILDYRDAAHFSCQEQASGYRMYRGVMPSWDNTPRRMERATSWINSSADAYQRWLERAVEQTVSEHDGDHRIVFINAWNEWAEGAHLEPDVRNGYARLSSTAVALGVTARGLDPQEFHQGSLPEHLAEARDWMWRRVCALCAGQLERVRLGFLEDYVAVLEHAQRHGCHMEARGDVLHVRRGEREIQVSGRAGVVRIVDLVCEQSPQEPFCFVVLQFNKWDVTARCLESLRALECERPLHVVLVDNGSDPEVVEASVRAVASMPNVHLLKMERNAGFAAGNNLGYRYARDTLGARFIAVINNDTRVQDRQFAARCESIYREWGCSAIGPDIVTADGRHENPWSDAMFSLAEWRELEEAYGADHAHFERTGQA